MTASCEEKTVVGAWFVLPYEPQDWEKGSELSIDPTEYLNQMKMKWPYIEQYPTVASKTHLLQWRLTSEDEVGGLQTNRQVVDFGSGPSFIEFVIWHRQFVLAKHRLYLCNNSSEKCVELNPGVTARDVEEMLDVL
jgi:hypothetical protein